MKPFGRGCRATGGGRGPAQELRARRHGVERYTDGALRWSPRCTRATGAVGAVIQAYLYRSEKDVAWSASLACRVRLCKGAYLEPPASA